MSLTVSIIVPAYNAQATLGECLTACLAQRYPVEEIIVVDDGSTDSTEMIARDFDVTYIHQKNAGPAAARNLGARTATGDIIVLTDSDCIPEPNWIEELMNGFDDDSVVAVGGTYGIANPESPLARLIHAEIMMRHENFGDTVDFLGSFNVAYRRDTFLELGGFDEDFRTASGEDNDLAYRIQDAGGVMRFVPTAVVNHYHPDQLLPYLRTQMNHGFWRTKLYAKHPNRKGGDQYAGKLDFMGPPFSLLAIAIPCLCIAVTLSTPNVPLLVILLSLVFPVAYLNMVILSMSDSTNETGWFESYGIALIFFLRDIFRCLGLIRGVWWFMILRRGTAP